MQLAGLDLAWHSNSNASAVAYGELQDALVVTRVDSALYSHDLVEGSLDSMGALTGIAIDAPLIIQNETGQRPCERRLSADYGNRKIGCHASNHRLYPDALSVALSERLTGQGFDHLGRERGRWQLECYPHPSIVELFGLAERLKYKKGRVDAKRLGQIHLAELLRNGLRHLPFDVRFSDRILHHFDPERILRLRGKALKENEDALDSVVCLLIAALYAVGNRGNLYGDTACGYIWVPVDVAA
ncbi:MAG: DUF429 domain-containing protein [Pseudomonadota bacterium]